MGMNGPSWGTRAVEARIETDRALELRKEADRQAVKAYNKRMALLGEVKDPIPTFGQIVNAGYHFLHVRCDYCRLTRAMALDQIQRRPGTSVLELAAAFKCQECGRRSATIFHISFDKGGENA